MAFISDNLKRGNPQFVATDAHEVIGWCDICRSDVQGSEHCGSLGMGLLASHRGRGLGHALLAATLAAARGQFERVELEVYASNAAAIALYENAGFALEGCRRHALLRDGIYEDIVVMGLLLN